MSDVNSAATLVLGVSTVKALEDLKTFRAAVQREKQLLAADLKTMTVGGVNLRDMQAGFLKQTRSIKQSLDAVVSQVNLMNKQLVDVTERGGRGVVAAQNKTNKELLANQRAYHRVAVALRDEASKIKDDNRGRLMFHRVAVLEAKERMAAAAAELKADKIKLAAREKQLAVDAIFDKAQQDAAARDVAREKARRASIMEERQKHLQGLIKMNERQLAVDAIFDKAQQDAAARDVAREKARRASIMEERQKHLAGLVKMRERQLAVDAIFNKAQQDSLLRAAAAVPTRGGFVDATNLSAMRTMSALTAQQAKEYAKLKPAIVAAGSAQHDWNTTAYTGHQVARGLSGAMGGLWLTYGKSLAPMIAAFTGAKTIMASLKEGSKFEYQSQFAGALGELPQAQLEAAKKQLFTLSKDSTYTVGDLAEGMRDLQAAGISVADSIGNVLPTAMKVALQGEIDLKESSSDLVAIMQMYRLGMKDIPHIGEALSKVAAETPASITSLMAAMKQAIGVNSQYNTTLEETLAIFGTLSLRKIESTKAGTYTRNFIAELVTPKTDRAEGLLEALGVSAFTADRKLRPVIETVRDLVVSLSKLNEASRVNVVDKTFGERGGKVANELYAEYADAAKKAIESGDISIKKSADGTYDMGKAVEALVTKVRQLVAEGKPLGNLAGAFEKLNESATSPGNALDTFIARLKETSKYKVDQLVVSLMNSLTQLYERNKDKVIGVLESLRKTVESPQFLAGLEKFGSVVASITQLLFEHGRALASVLAAYLAFKTVSFAGGIIAGIGAALTRAAGSMAAYSTAVKLSGGVLQHAGTVSGTYVGGIARQWKAAGAAATSASGMFGRAAAVTSIVGRGAVALAGGPIGMLITAISVAASAWFIFRDNAKSSLDEVSQKIPTLSDELAEMHGRVSSLAKGSDEAQASALLAKAKARLAQLEKNFPTESKEKADPKRPYSTGSLAEQYRNEVRQAEADLAKLKSLKVEQEKSTKATFSPGTRELGIPDKVGKYAWMERYVKDFKADVSNYQDQLGVIAESEKSQLEKLKALHSVGLVTEADYLAKRNSIREAADKEAQDKLALYVRGQEAEAATAQDSYNKMALMAKFKGQSKDETVVARLKELQNRVDEANSKAAQAKVTGQSRTDTRSEANVLDALSLMKEKYGDTDEQLRNAQEMVKAVEAQTAAMRMLTTAERDSNVVAMEADAARLAGLITSAEAQREVLGIANAEIGVLKQKAETLTGLQAQYEAFKKAQIDMDNDWIYGAKKGLKEYAETTTSAAKVSEDAFKKFFKNMEDVLLEFIHTGKFEFKSFADSVVADLLRIQIQRAVTQPLANWMGGTTSSGYSGGSGLGGLLGTLTGGLTGMPSNIAAFSGADFNSISAFSTFFAKGGAPGAAGLNAYRNSVVSKPTLFPFAKGVGLMGEKPGSPGEAIMPLTRTSNGDLGVKVDSGGGSNITNLTINVSSPEGKMSKASLQQVQAAVSSGMARSARRNG